MGVFFIAREVMVRPTKLTNFWQVAVE